MNIRKSLGLTIDTGASASALRVFGVQAFLADARDAGAAARAAPLLPGISISKHDRRRGVSFWYDRQGKQLGFIPSRL